MLQVITLYSDPVPNMFTILPPEILSLILIEMDVDVVRNAWMLMRVSRVLEDLVKSSIKYVDRMTAYGIRMLDLFVGIKYLNVINLTSPVPEFTCLSFFNLNIFRNLTSLTISPDHSSELGNIFSRNPEFFPNNMMPRLMSLRIHEDRNNQHDVKIDMSIFPSLEVLILDNCFLKNIHEFKSLKKLSFNRIIIRDMTAVNTLNITELILNQVECQDMMLAPTLRSLTLEGMYINPNILSKHNLTELRLLDIEWKYENEFRLNIPTLRSLDVRNPEEIDLVGFPNLETLKISDSDICHLSRIYPILWSDGLSMKNLTRLDIILNKSYSIDLDVNNLIFPRLRHLNLTGYACDTVIISGNSHWLRCVRITEYMPIHCLDYTDVSTEEYCSDSSDYHSDYILFDESE